MALLGTVLLTASGVLAGISAGPETEDPPGDAVHDEFKIQEPSLDVTKVWFTWEEQTLQDHLQIEDVQTYGADGTQDETDAGTRYDVYWTMGGQDDVARLGDCTACPDAGCWISSEC